MPEPVSLTAGSLSPAAWRWGCGPQTTMAGVDHRGDSAVQASSEQEPATDLVPVPVRTVPVMRPFVWLRLGWRDLTRAPVSSLPHGLAVAVGAWLILAITLRQRLTLPIAL
jgi:hypothetical protein